MGNDIISLSVKSIEQKPHRLYIRYLLTKKWSPNQIIADLKQLGLSSPIEAGLIKYYKALIRPIIRKHKLGFLYQDFDNYIADREGPQNGVRPPREISFRIDVGNNIDTQIAFLRLIGDLGVADLWQNELFIFYGKKESVPTDPETGKSLIGSFLSGSMPWDIVNSPHRYVIDELILEGVSAPRIKEYMSKNHKLKLHTDEIRMYKIAFFSIETSDIKDSLLLLEAEKQNVLHHIKSIDANLRRVDQGISVDETVPEMLVKKKALYTRVSDLESSIKMLQSKFSEKAAGLRSAKTKSHAQMIEEMVEKTYAKFSHFSNYEDRDAVNPMYKLTRMMGLSLEMLEKAKDAELRGSVGGQAEMIRLITEREDTLAEEYLDKEKRLKEEKHIIDSDLDESDIMGIDELTNSLEEDGEN